MRTPPRRLALLPAVLLAVSLGASPAAADEIPVPGPGTRVAAGAPALPAGLSPTSFLVADLDTGQILAAKDAHHRLLPASTLKVLTALTLIPRVDKASKIVPTYDDVAIEGSRVGLLEDVKYPAYQVFRAMLMTSGNDAANALATNSGGQQAVADLMNGEAARIGATDTHAVNPSGLDAPGQLSTAYDLALIGREAMRLSDFRQYVGTKRSTILGRMGKPLRITTHDKLLFNYDGAIGIKNGYTVKAGATYIGAATRNGHSIIVTVLHAKARVWPEVASLLDWGFAAEAAGATPVGQLYEPPGPPPVPAGDPATAKVVPAARTEPTQGLSALPVSVVLLTAGGTALA
ncbi:MAG: D-alanyl-D-alanine carboxypeptidase, partial [Actinobacteria bacterium]|nr:D-alanyl-D-alanine carboxypeptidase [Actinomycetota bacterium]MCA1721829.1 D-alanyl-D-alanine carboxypeptidase [Actinomycetota bacterium]